MTTGVDLGSFVLYQSEGGESYHRSPVCAGGTPEDPGRIYSRDFDLENLDMNRFRDLSVDAEDLCKNCSQLLIRELEKRVEASR